MSMTNEIDHSTLRWVKKELDETLREAASALERYSEDPADSTQLQFCVTQLHQVRGILQMLELHGAAMLTEEMEQLGAAILEGGAARGESGIEVLMGAILRLRDYLERLEGGQQDAALLILPLVNELRAARGQPIIAESALFAPDLDRAPATPRCPRDGSDRLATVAGQARGDFQRGLLGFLRGRGAPAGLARMREAVDRLDAAAPDDRSGAFWWITGTVAEALAEQALPADAAVRNLLGQVDRQIKAVAAAGASAARPEGLMRGLLYYLAGARPATPRIEAAQALYDLPELIEDQRRLEQAREGLFGPGADAFRSVAEAIREDLAGVKDTLDLYVRGSAREPERLATAAAAMRRIADTLGVLGLAAPRRVVREQAELVQGLDGSDDALTVMKAAESLLYVESALQGLGGRGDEPTGATPDGAAGDSPESTLFRSEYREVVTLTLDEAITELGRVKEAVVRFLESHEGSQLEGLDERFASIRGALGIMELSRAAGLVEAAARYVTERLARDSVPPPAEALDDLADAVTSIEYYLEALRDGRGGAGEVLDVAENGLRRLGETLPADEHGEPPAEASASPDADAGNAGDAGDAGDADGGAATQVTGPGTEAPETGGADGPGPAISADAPAGADAPIDFSRKRGRVDYEVAVRAEALDPEIVEIFVEEAEEVLATLRETFPRWRDSPEDEAALLTTRRMFHTLKGSGRLAGALLLGELAWSVENLLNRVLDRSREGDAEVSAVVQSAMDVIPDLLREFQGGAPPAADVRALMREAARLADPPAAGEEAGADDSGAAAARAADDAPPDTEAPVDAAGSGEVADTAGEPGTAAPAEAAEAQPPGAQDTPGEATNEGPAPADAGEGAAGAETAGAPEAPQDRGAEPAEPPGRPAAAAHGDTPPADRDRGGEVTGAAADSDGSPAAVPAMDPILYEIFSKEAEDHLAAVEAFLQRVGPGETLRVSDGLIRSLHTLTGSARMADVGPISRLGRRLEDLVRIRFADGASLAGEERDLLEQCVARMRAVVAALGDAGSAIPEVEDLVGEVDRLKGGAPVPSFEAMPGAMPADEDPPEPWEAQARSPEDALDAVDAADDRPDAGEAAGAAGSQPEPGASAGAEEEGDAGLQTDAETGAYVEGDPGAGGAAATGSETDVRTDAESDGETDGGLGIDTDAGADVRAGTEADAGAGPGTETDAEAGSETRTEAGTEADAGSEAGARGETGAATPPGGDEAWVPAAAYTGVAPQGERLAAQDVSADDDAELHGIFLEEAEDLRGLIAELVADWQNEDSADAPGAELQRALHTLKGGARLAGETGIARLCHAAEGLVESAAAGHAAADDTFFGLLGETTEQLAVLLQGAAVGHSAEADAELLGRLEAAAEPPAAAASRSSEPAARPPAEVDDDAPPPDDELVEVFLEEAAEILGATEAHLNEWREGADEASTLVALQRALHTLKGGARMAGFPPVADLAHALETLLRRVQDETVAVEPQLFELLERANDALVAQREAAEAGRPMAGEAELIRRIEAVTAGAPAVAADGAAAAPGTEDEAATAPAADSAGDRQAVPGAEDTTRRQTDVVRVRSELLDDLVNFAGEVSIYRARLEQQAGAIGFNLGELGQTVRRLREQLRNLEIETEAQILHRVEREYELQDRYGEDFDPLEMDRFSQIQELSRALSESVNDLSSIEGTLENLNRESETLLLQQSRVNAELQDGLMRTRMVPFANLAPRLRRIVRQASQELGREARLRVLGAEGEMDRTVLERIVPPLEHMLRNAVAHGIEEPDTRRAAGKPEGGTISVSLAREGADVVIRVADDGGGMDLEAIRRKAIRRGLMNADSALADREVMQFVLESGFSTAESVTQIAGRGVGMDVVNAEIKQLGGNLEIDSTPGEGTRFTVRLPFTLALNQALLCEVGDEVYAVPLSSVEGVVRMTGEELTRRLEAPDAARYEYAGAAYSLRSLGAVLGAGEPPRPAPGSRLPLLLVQAGESRMALQVDGLIGSRDIVVKSPGPQIASVPGVLGATILADGRVVLILDVSALVRFAMVGDDTPRATPHAAAAERRSSRPLVMVVDDSITMRKVASRLLERNDIEVVTAKDGVDAVAALQDRVPDAMLLDIEMPRMDGYEVAVHMRNDQRLRDVPIIMITSRTGEKHRQRALDIGVDRYIGKPYQEGDLLVTVRELLEHGRAGG